MFRSASIYNRRYYWIIFLLIVFAPQIAALGLWGFANITTGALHLNLVYMSNLFSPMVMLTIWMIGVIPAATLGWYLNRRRPFFGLIPFLILPVFAYLIAFICFLLGGAIYASTQIEKISLSYLFAIAAIYAIGGAFVGLFAAILLPSRPRY